MIFEQPENPRTGEKFELLSRVGRRKTYREVTTGTEFTVGDWRPMTTGERLSMHAHHQRMMDRMEPEEGALHAI